MKKSLLMSLCIALCACLAIGGTMAYLQDTDSDVNVMTVGNVKIEQNEWQRAEGVSAQATVASKQEGTLVPFVQGQMVFPSVHTGEKPYNTAASSSQFWWGDYVTANNAASPLWFDDYLQNEVDKIVLVTNTGKSDAYVRTVFAFELPEGMTLTGTTGNMTNSAITKPDIKVNNNAAFRYIDCGTTEIDGTRYQLYTATYNIGKGIAKPGETLRPSLM